MLKNSTRIKVRYAETDQMGVVHHANYALYLELARIEWLSVLGFSYADMEKDGVILPVVSLFVNCVRRPHLKSLLTMKFLMNRVFVSLQHQRYWLLSAKKPKDLFRVHLR